MTVISRSRTKKNCAPAVLVPDDLLVRSGDGFRIVGRLSDVINVAGKKVSPAEVEAVLQQFAGIREAVVFGRSQLCAMKKSQPVSLPKKKSSKASCWIFVARLSGWQVPKRIVFLKEMPVTERGKISRRILAERYAAGISGSTN